MSRRFFLLAIASTCAVYLLAAPLRIDPFRLPDARAYATGGYHAALAKDASSLFENPAGLYRAEPEFLVTQLSLRLTGPFLGIASAVLGGGDDLMSAAISALSAAGSRPYMAADLGGPVSFGYVGEGLGFGVFNRTRASLDVRSATSIGVLASEELLLVGGYAFGFGRDEGHALDFGILAKGYIRGGIQARKSLFDLETLLANVAEEDFGMVTGIGLDLGLKYSWAKIFSFGLVARDVYSPGLATEYSDLASFLANPSSAKLGEPAPALVYPDLAAGFAFAPPPAWTGGLIDDLSVALDYNDLLDLLAPLPRNPVLNIGLGAEARVLDILIVRVGLAGGLLSAGFGLDFGPVRVNTSVWGSELGIEPGARPAYNLMLSTELRL